MPTSKQVLVYGDSLSWGLIPATRARLDFGSRWPCVLEQQLLNTGYSLRVNENCINGRRSAWGDPFKTGRNGARGLAQVIEMHSPLDLVILMLGVNDFQAAHNNTPALSAMGVAQLIDIIRGAPVEPGMPTPEILVVAPPELQQAKGEITDKFSGAVERSKGLAKALEQMAHSQSAYFYNAAQHITTSTLDGVHLDQDQHTILGTQVARFVDQKIWQTVHD